MIPNALSAEPKISFVRASLMSAAVRRLEALGLGTDPLLSQAGITRSQLENAYGEIPLPQFVAFLESAAREGQDPHIGAHIGDSLSVGDTGPIGIALSLSESIDVGVTRFARYTNALQSGTESQWIKDGDQRIFTYRITDPRIWPRAQDSELSLVSLIRLIRSSFLSSWTPDEVHFEHQKPQDSAALERLLRCNVQYAQPINRILVRAKHCNKTARTEDTAHLDVLERHIGEIIGTSLPQTSTLREAVEAVINANMGITQVNIKRVSVALMMTPRSLQRQLALEGTSYRKLLEKTRRERGSELLSLPEAKVSQVAEMLGYSDPTAFWRAWKSWTGACPSAPKRSTKS